MNFFIIFNINKPGFSEQELESKYINLQSQYHPDSENADEAKSDIINQAYQTLKNPTKCIQHYFEVNNIDVSESKVSEKFMLEQISFLESIENLENAELKKVIAEKKETNKILLEKCYQAISDNELDRAVEYFISMNCNNRIMENTNLKILN